jgi:hypothetical protein
VISTGRVGLQSSHGSLVDARFNEETESAMRRLQTSVVMTLAVLGIVVMSAAQAGAAEGIFKDGTSEKPTKVGTKGKLLSTTVVLQAKGHLSLACTGAVGVGEILSTTTGEGTVTYTGCEGVGKKCKSTGAGTGEVVAKEISVSPVLEETTTAGVFEPAVLTKILKEVAFECGTTQKVIVTGGMLDLIPAEAETETGWLGTNKEGLLFHVVAEQEGGKQRGTGKYRESVGGSVKTIVLLTSATGTETFTNAESGLSAEGSIEFDEKVSIKA